MNKWVANVDTKMETKILTEKYVLFLYIIINYTDTFTLSLKSFPIPAASTTNLYLKSNIFIICEILAAQCYNTPKRQSLGVKSEL